MSKTDCRQVVARLYEYLDGELTPDNAEAIREHLELCRQCYPRLCFARSFRDALRRAAAGQPVAPERLRERLDEILRAEGLEPDA